LNLVFIDFVFIDFDKAYNRVPRELLGKCIENKGVIIAYIQVVKNMYEGV
jgi:hypothetical protein